MMANIQHIHDDTDLARNRVIGSNLKDGDKKHLMDMLQQSKMAVLEQDSVLKLQKLTESVNSLTKAFALHKVEICDLIKDSIKQENNKQCSVCKAMQHALEVEKEEREKEIINEYLKANGQLMKGENGNDGTNHNMTKLQYINAIIQKPYIWICLAIMVFSPYSVQILKQILDFIGK